MAGNKKHTEDSEYGQDNILAAEKKKDQGKAVRDVLPELQIL